MKSLKILTFLSFIFCLTLSAQDWEFQSSIIPSDPNYFDQFGNSLAKDGNYLVVGALYDNPEEGEIFGNGVVHVFHEMPDGSYERVFKLVDENNFSNKHYGHDVDIQGNIIAVGAPFYDVDEKEGSIAHYGAVFIYEIVSQSEINLIQIIKSKADSDYEQFGYTVKIDQDRLIIGAPRSNHYFNEYSSEYPSGIVYVYSVNESGFYEEKQKLVPDNRKPYANFGEDLDFDKDYLLIGSPGESNDLINPTNLMERGTAYMYKRTTDNDWEFLTKFESEDTENYSGFGKSVSLDEGMAAVGAPFENEYYSFYTRYRGVVYTLQVGNNPDWEIIERITPSNSSDFDLFGKNVSLKNKSLAVFRQGSFDNREEIVIYKFDDFGNSYLNPSVKLPEIEGHIEFSSSFFMDSAQLFIGSKYSNLSGNDAFYNSGAVFIYNKPMVQIIPPQNIDITVYPNPTTDGINILFNKLPNYPNILLISPGGGILYDKTFYDNEIIMESLSMPDPPGIYLLKIVSDGKKDFVHKIVKI